MSINFLDYEKDIVAKAKSYAIPSMEWKDTAQELRLAVWLNGNKYNPKRGGGRTFVIRVIKNKLIDLARTANRKKRFIDNYHLSLNEMAEKAEKEEKEFDIEDPQWQRVFVQGIRDKESAIWG